MHDRTLRPPTPGRLKRVAQPPGLHPLHVKLTQPLTPWVAPLALLLQLADVGAELRPPGGDVVQTGMGVELRQKLGVTCLRWGFWFRWGRGRRHGSFRVCWVCRVLLPCGDWGRNATMVCGRGVFLHRQRCTTFCRKVSIHTLLIQFSHILGRALSLIINTVSVHPHPLSIWEDTGVGSGVCIW